MGYHKREDFIKAFLNSGYKAMDLDWYAMGYTNAKTCRASLGSNGLLTKQSLSRLREKHMALYERSC